MEKEALFSGDGEYGQTVFPLHGRGSAAFEKTASLILPDVARYIENLRPQAGSQYVLVNALGAGEYYGSNVNGDYFPEAGLIHAPASWRGVPAYDEITSKDWPYGYPTFYRAHPFMHHKNKDPGRAFGVVSLAVWNAAMHRVELVVRVDKDKCDAYGGTAVWDKLLQGQFPDVSMGCKVPYDTCSICLDWGMYRDAQATFDPKKHKYVGEAVLSYHRKRIADTGRGIRGLSITRKDYCEHGLREMNRIRPDGRKVFVYNDYPNFFDISFVFIGADRTAKVMFKVADPTSVYSAPGAEKTAAFKSAKDKDAEIIKDITSDLAAKIAPGIAASDPPIPSPVLNRMARFPLPEVLSTTSGLGIILRPAEFQRIILIQMQQPGLADAFEAAGTVFPRSSGVTPMGMSPDSFLPALLPLLLPYFFQRSALAPAIHARALAPSSPKTSEKSAGASPSSDLLAKIGAAYTGYRLGVLGAMAGAPDLMAKTAHAGLLRLAEAPLDQVFSPLSVAYARDAFWSDCR